MEPRYNADLGIYEWGDPAPPEPAPIEPAFVKEAIEHDFDPPTYSGVTTFGAVYPVGTRGSISTAETPDAEQDTFDPLQDWRVEPAVADDVLLSLPESTPRMVRALLTLLMGAMRNSGSRHSKPS